MAEFKPVLFPVGKLIECDHCKALKGIKPHPMLADLWRDNGYCECRVGIDWIGKEETVNG